jgi:hypothetical protein
MPKLYEIPEGALIECEASDGSKWIRFHRIDGMYSYCLTQNGNVAHLSASTDLVKIDENIYKLK